MPEQDMDQVLGKSVTNKKFGERLCEKLQSGSAEAVRKFCQLRAEANLSDKEIQWLITNRDKFCKCTADCRNQLGLSYDFDQSDDDPKYN